MAIVIPVHNRRNVILNCLDQLQNLKKDGFCADIVIIDDGSTDGTTEAISKEFPYVTVLKGDGNLWWAGGVNMGLEFALNHGYDFIYVMNDDTELLPDSLQILYDTLKEYDNAVCSSVIMDREKNIIVAGAGLTGFFKKERSQVSGKFHDSYSGRIIKADTLATKSVLIPTVIAKKVGYFDAKHFPHNYSDFEYFIRVKEMGFSLLVNMDSHVYTERSDTNFHYLILNKNLLEILKTFLDVKYGNHLKTLYNLSIKREGIIIGPISFLFRLFPYIVWMGLKAVLPKKVLRKVLIRTGRIKE